MHTGRVEPSTFHILDDPSLIVDEVALPLHHTRHDELSIPHVICSLSIVCTTIVYLPPLVMIVLCLYLCYHNTYEMCFWHCNANRTPHRAAWLRAKTAQKKIAVKGLLERKGSRKPTEDEAHGQSVPCRFPRDAYCPTYLAGVGEFHAEHLTTDNMKLDDLSKEMWKKTFGTAGTTPVDNPSCPAGPSGSAAPSGGEVQMSG